MASPGGSGPVTAEWNDGVVRFPGPEAFRDELSSYIKSGALRMKGHCPEPLVEFDFELEVPGTGERLPLKGMIVASAGEGYMVQLLGLEDEVRDRLLALGARDREGAQGGEESDIAEWYQRGVTTSAIARFRAQQISDIPTSGRLENPTDLAGLRGLPLGARLSVSGLDPVSTVGLIRYLGWTRATGTLHVATDERRFALPILRGRFQLTQGERERFDLAMFAPSGTYEFERDQPEVRAARQTTTSWQLVADCLRRHIRHANAEELRACLPLDAGIELTEEFLERGAQLGLSGAEHRAIEREFDPGTPLSRILRGSRLGKRALLNLVFYLDLVGAVRFVEAG